MVKTTYDPRLLKKAQVAGILELACHDLELSASQRRVAEDRYVAIGKWLSEADERLLREAEVYAQGSIALETTVRPLASDEFDVDLVCHVPGSHRVLSPLALKSLVGNRLKSHGHYRSILEEKARCWRVNYAGEFHLDITPSLPNPVCENDGELVPDRRLSTWKASNPRGYLAWFESHAQEEPRFLSADPEFSDLRADIEALPGPSKIKGILRRTVQICKRHRDVFFSERPDSKLAPISIIITTLAAKSYVACVRSGGHETDLDLLIAVVRAMPSFVEIGGAEGRESFHVWNETTENENFAEKWNQDPRLATAFFQWQQKALSDLSVLAETEGIDRLQARLTGLVGSRSAGAAVGSLTDAIGASRKMERLTVTAGLGLSTGTARGVSVRPNTFYGA